MMAWKNERWSEQRMCKKKTRKQNRERAKYEKKYRRRCKMPLTAIYGVKSLISPVIHTILTTLALQFLPSYLFLWRNNGFFQQSARPFCPTLSFLLLLSPSSSASLHPWNADFRPQGLKSRLEGS